MATYREWDSSVTEWNADNVTWAGLIFVPPGQGKAPKGGPVARIKAFPMKLRGLAGVLGDSNYGKVKKRA